MNGRIGDIGQMDNLVTTDLLFGDESAVLSSEEVFLRFISLISVFSQ